MTRQKVAVLTCSVAGNYGTVLQCYATQHAFSMGNRDIEIVHYSEVPIKKRSRWLSGSFSIKSGIASVLFYIPRKRKRDALDGFRKKIRYSDRLFDVTSPEELNAYLNKYECVCVGSDQVWNPNIQDPKVFLLSNIHDGVFKFSYSSSMGANIVDEGLQNLYLEKLKEFRYVSVRENGLCDFLKMRLNRDIYRVLDPTLYLPSDFWRKEEEEYQVIGKYVFIYLQAHSSNLMKLAKKRAQEINGELLLLSDRWYPFFLDKGKNVCGITVGQFLYLIDHAEEVYTNSYHGMVFSINFKKKFYVEKSRKNDDRIDTVLDIFGLHTCDVSAGYHDDSIKDHDMGRVDLILDKERKQMRNYIRMVFDEIDNG